MAGSQCHARKGVDSRGCRGEHAAKQSKPPGKRAICGPANQLWVAWKGRYTRASAARFLPHNSAATQFFIVLSIQMEN
eukprot:1161803-Pelagomonas_calceolata.AAC.23